METATETTHRREAQPISGPLNGYRILEWGAWQAGPAAAMMLGDLGADVIKIENRGSGDPSRGLEPGFDIRYKTARTCYFEVINRNKRGISLDLAKPEGREVLYGLARHADAFITNFRPQVVERYGMGYEALSQINPKLVYTMVTGFGPKGPDAEKRSYDSIGQARSGLMRQCDPEMPRYVIGGVGDSVPAIIAACGTLTGLLAREKTGRGQRIDVSQLSSLMYIQLCGLAMDLIGGYPIAPRHHRNPQNALVNAYKCKDGKWVFACNMEGDKHWPNLCRALNIPEAEHDPRFDTNIKRAGNSDLVDLLDSVFATRDRDEWLDILWKHDLVFDRVNDYKDLLEDVQVQANNYLPTFDHPVYGPTTYPPVPMDLSETPGALRIPAPEFGQHTEEVLMELLGMDWEAIGQLKEREVI